MNHLIPKPRIFLSYARDDDHLIPDDTDPNYYLDLNRSFTRRLHADLSTEFDVWWDREDMPSRGFTFGHEIREAIGSCEKMILVIGPAALRSAYVDAEYRYAHSNCIPIIPILRSGSYEDSANFIGQIDVLDFRERGRYEEKLRLLIKKLNDEIRIGGALYGVGDLPPFYVERKEALRTVTKTLLANLVNPLLPPLATTISQKDNANKLVTVYGMAGIGKSTLVKGLSYDCEVRSYFPDGLIWIPMGLQPDIATRIADVAVSLGDKLSEYPDVERARIALSRLLKDKAVLIILDDVWDHAHVEPFRVLGDRCRILVTTRSISLQKRIGGTALSLAKLDDDEALALFAHKLSLEVHQLPDIASLRAIIELLGGHTLAISIAAAWLAEHPAKTPSAYLNRLQRGWDGDNPLHDLNLIENDKNLNLELSLGESYYALNSDELRRRFRLLGKFAREATFSRDAAMHLWGENEDDDDLVLLEHASLLTHDTTKDRYYLHNSLHAYAYALLVRNNEFSAAAQRHFDHYATIYGNSGANRNETNHPVIHADFLNIEEALLWGFLHETARSCDLLANIDKYLVLRQSHLVRMNLYEVGLKAARNSSYTLGEANCLFSMGTLYYARDDYPKATDHYQAALTLFQAIQAREGEAECLRSLGNIHKVRDEYDKATEYYQTALAIFRDANAYQGEANCLINLGDILYMRNAYVEAFDLYSKALVLFKTINDGQGQANSLRNLGDVHYWRNEYSQAIERYNEAQLIYQDIGDAQGKADCMNSIGVVYETQDDYETAIFQYEAALVIFDSVHALLSKANCLRNLGDIYRLREDYESAVQRYETALAIYYDLSVRRGEANCLYGLAHIQRLRYEYRAATELYDAALNIYRELEIRQGEADCFRHMAEVSRLCNQYSLAMEYYQTAIPIYRITNDMVGEGNCLRGIGETYRMRNEHEKAFEQFNLALSLFQSAGERIGEIYSLVGLAKLYMGHSTNEISCNYWRQAFKIVDELPSISHLSWVADMRYQYEQACGHAAP
ncbi:MAG: tetratricopeptide repeat protein [Anaerolineae bacterium]|nr:tetratricopeptide repeat protein [Anaerolineae bacterium]